MESDVSIWPALIILLLQAIQVGKDVSKHGENYRETKVEVITTIIALLFIDGLLYWGGFFDVLLK